MTSPLEEEIRASRRRLPEELQLELQPHPHLEHGSVAYVREADGGLRGLRCGGSPLQVPLPFAAITAGTAAKAASRPLSAAVSQEFSTLVGDARQRLLQADELLQRSLLGEERPLRKLELCPCDLALVRHAAAAAADGAVAGVGAECREELALKVAALRAQLREAEAQLRLPSREVGPPPASPAVATAAAPPVTSSPAVSTAPRLLLGGATFAVPALPSLPRTRPTARCSASPQPAAAKPSTCVPAASPPRPGSVRRAASGADAAAAARAKRSPGNIAATPLSDRASPPSAPRCVPRGGDGSELPSRGRENTLGVLAKRREVGGSPIRSASGVAAAFEVAYDEDDPFDEEMQIEKELAIMGPAPPNDVEL